jgi:hypothetical protein
MQLNFIFAKILYRVFQNDVCTVHGSMTENLPKSGFMEPKMFNSGWNT